MLYIMRYIGYTESQMEICKKWYFLKQLMTLILDREIQTFRDPLEATNMISKIRSFIDDIYPWTGNG